MALPANVCDAWGTAEGVGGKVVWGFCEVGAGCDFNGGMSEIGSEGGLNGGDEGGERWRG